MASVAPKPPPHDDRYDDVRGCPLGVVRAASEVVAYSRMVGDSPAESLALADRALESFLFKNCPATVVKGLSPWAELRELLVKAWPSPGLSRRRSAP